MGSTNFNAPPFKITLLAIGVVLALHVLTAMALVAIRPPAPAVKLPESNPPIEIQMITLDAETEQPEVVIDTAEPEKEIKPQPKPAAAIKPQTVKKSQPVAKTKPPVKAPVKSQPKNMTSKSELKPKSNTQPDTSNAIKNEPFRHEIERQESISMVQADTLAANNQRKILAAQAEKAAQQAHVQAMRDAQIAADAKAAREIKAEADAKAAQIAKAEAAAKVAQEAEAAARNKAAAEAKAAAAVSNTPVDFTANNASWVSSPNFSFPDRAKRGARSGDTFNVTLVLQVNKQGGIDSVRLAQSSGNALLDREAQRQVRSGKFKPFTKNGIAVVGNVTLPISYAVP